MPLASLEHVNLTVSDAKATAAWLCEVFGWTVRWHGEVLDGAGETYHVGDDTRYLAIFGPRKLSPNPHSNYTTAGGLNHVGVVTDDLQAVEARVVAAGFTPEKHADYEPGRRFYFRDSDGIEYEVASYA